MGLIVRTVECNSCGLVWEEWGPYRQTSPLCEKCGSSFTNYVPHAPKIKHSAEQHVERMLDRSISKGEQNET